MVEFESELPYIELETIRKAIEGEDTAEEEAGNLTPVFDFERGEFCFNAKGEVVVDDGVVGMRNLIQKAHSTARNKYVIYSESYGTDEEEALKENAPEEIKNLIIEEAIRDCLIYDDRIKSISDIELTKEKGAYLAKYTIYTIFGNIDIEKEV